MKIFSTLAAASLALGATAADATILVVFDDFDGGFASFNATISAAGETTTTQVLTPGTSGNPADFGAFSIRRNNGSSVTVDDPYFLSGASPSRSTTGGVIDISPGGSGPGIGAKGSGITFTFDAPINALGFEVGDWATCCQPSDLYIQFGNNTPIKVGGSTSFGDQFLTNGGAGVFVAAFDDTDTFSTVSFWGDGFGEFLVIGGTIRFASVGQGTLPPVVPGAIPEPATWAMLIAGFGIVGMAARRRREAVSA
jgi:hypothetical protein